MLGLGVSHSLAVSNSLTQPAVALPARGVACNALALSFQTESGNTNYNRNSCKVHKVPNNATWTKIKITDANYAATSTAVITSCPVVTLIRSIQYLGVVYPVTWSGASSKTLQPGDLVTSDEVAGLTLPPGAEFIEHVNVVGPGGSQTYLGTQQTSAFFGEFLYANAAATPVYATTGIGYGATATATVSGGNITALTRTAAGSGYTGSAYVYAGEVQPSGKLEFKQIGTVTQSGGGITNTFTISSGTPPAGVAAWVNPIIRICYGTGSAGPSNAIRCYTAVLITGQPDSDVESVLVIGDSMPRGNGNNLTADINQNQGIYEVGINNRCGILNLAIGSGKLQLLQNTTTYAKLYDIIAISGCTKAALSGGTNDINYDSRTNANLKTYVASIKATLATYGIETSVATIMARTASADSWTTLVGQTALTAGFGDGDVAEQFNADVISGVVVSDWGYIDAKPTLNIANLLSIECFRVDLGTITTDGVHFNQVGMGACQLDASYLAQYAALS